LSNTLKQVQYNWPSIPIQFFRVVFLQNSNIVIQIFNQDFSFFNRSYNLKYFTLFRTYFFKFLRDLGPGLISVESKNTLIKLFFVEYRYILFVIDPVEVVYKFFDDWMRDPLGFTYFDSISVWGTGSTFSSFWFCHRNVVILVVGCGTL